ncbi:MAG TPA: dethiobiotin synthase [Cyanobacteria bacterium UBA9971]|nr:dethiobiotin synthase [Cyanobacteria bacterium UBA9971]
MNIFITGTDTDVGKTVVTAGLASAVRSSGYSVGVFKPVQTGSFKKNNELISPDLEFVKSVDDSILTYASYNFKEPAAPSLAADLEGIDIYIDKIVEDYKELEKKCDFVIVEGAGGLLTPIKNSFSMRDLVKTLDLPLIIVARPDLGTINHTLLTIEAAKNKNIKIAGVIISGYPSEIENVAIRNAPAMIKELSGEEILGILPKIEDLNNNPAVLKEVFLKHININELFF